MSLWAQTVGACFPTPSGDPTLPVSVAQNGLLQNGSGRRGSVLQDKRRFTFRRLVTSYWPDWLLIAFLWILLVAIARAPGYKREFSLTDISIQHTFAEHERVPINALLVISLIIPLCSLLLLSLFVARNGWDIHNALAGCFISWLMAGVITNIIKMAVGRPRPDLIARCEPKPGAHDRPVYGLSNITICTQEDWHKLNDGFKSFPSGHSSLSFAGLGFLSFYLAGKMHIWHPHGHRNRAWLALTPLLGAIMVAISRTEDNRHHWHDVLVGSLLGYLVSFITYRAYFPSLHHPVCHLPLLPPQSEDSPIEDEEYDANDLANDRLLSDEGVPRQSEEAAAWQRP